jgi:hypothetical protein
VLPPCLPSPLNFTVEEHDPAEREPFIVHAGANAVSVARAAFAEVAKQLPGRHVVLRNGARVLEQTASRGEHLKAKGYLK